MAVTEETQQVAAKAPFVLPALIKGRFQPVFWQPLGEHGERLTVAVLVEVDAKISAVPILTKERCEGIFTQQRAGSANGILATNLEFLQKQASRRAALEELDENGEGLKPLWKGFSLGPIRPISGPGTEGFAQRASEMCSVLITPQAQ